MSKTNPYIKKVTATNINNVKGIIIDTKDGRLKINNVIIKKLLKGELKKHTNYNTINKYHYITSRLM